MNKTKNKDDVESTLQLTPSQVQQALSEAKKIAAKHTLGQQDNTINWDVQIEALKANPPKTVDEAVSRIVADCAVPDTSQETREALEQMMKDNPAIVKVLTDFIR